MTDEDESQALAAHKEFAGWEFLLFYTEGMSWRDYVEKCRNIRLGLNLPKGRVPATFFIAEIDGQLIGRVSIRHELNTYLFNYGGHIGYGVRPEYRRRGYATEILRQALIYIRDLGVSKVLITCFDENIASVRVIESQGGVLENIVKVEGKPLRRYWVL
jgi:predicted acetyltransferase